jgi:hypothetical protein
LYELGPKVLVIIPKPWHEVSEDDQLLLSKILLFVKQSLSSVQILALDAVDVSNLVYQPMKIIAFGSKVRFSKETLQTYKLFRSDQVSILQADSLNELDPAKKKILQNVLKDMFQL